MTREQLETVALSSADALRIITLWLYGTESRFAAADSLFRMQTSLKAGGLRVSVSGLGWRRTYIKSLAKAGWGMGVDGWIRRLRAGESTPLATGVQLREFTFAVDALIPLCRELLEAVPWATSDAADQLEDVLDRLERSDLTLTAEARE